MAREGLSRAWPQDLGRSKTYLNCWIHWFHWNTDTGHNSRKSS
uniref:1-deoxy-D-xylulose 5-phosphate reductoisomerase n=1 Tax=Rhizophora mucronata TaxID=61149 RepID=A0A2P2KHK7_RHIMU